MREKGERVSVLRDGRKGAGRFSGILHLTASAIDAHAGVVRAGPVISIFNYS